MGILLEAVEVIQKRIEEENYRPWLEVIEEVKNEWKFNYMITKNKFK
ncbi:hypothetical protein [Tepidibacter hydrothermalis]|uniref:Uncharacterized protein n=1 Tax=Tepidibacter hydrothermalis TaxID=3036126 RepID=A0ABY8EAV5_9FIRM|nr:hypothetical protein [Tepidibacter hydrothermalis]WFD08734.1 hypothetical protein P4S50_10025 [Tepidibacter hydrothermalis]